MLTGSTAIAIASALGLTLRKHADPLEGARSGLSIEEAQRIAAEDPSLVYLTHADRRVRSTVDGGTGHAVDVRPGEVRVSWDQGVTTWTATDTLGPVLRT